MPIDISTQQGARAFINQTIEQNKDARADSRVLFSASSGNRVENQALNINVWNDLQRVTAEPPQNDRECFENILRTAYPEDADSIIEAMDQNTNAISLEDIRGAYNQFKESAVSRFNNAFENSASLVDRYPAEALELLTQNVNDTAKVLIEGAAQNINANNFLSEASISVVNEEITKLAVANGENVEKLLPNQFAELRQALNDRRNPDTAPYTSSPKLNADSIGSLLSAGLESPEAGRGRDVPGFEALSTAYQGASAIGVNRTTTGLPGLANILIDQCLYAEHFGPLEGSNPALSAGPHGPYFILLNNDQMAQEKANNTPWAQNHCYTLDCITSIAVPTVEQKNHIIAILDRALQNNFITQGEHTTAVGKVDTYAEAVARKENETQV